MKHVMGWWFPDHEKHLPEWLAHPKNRDNVMHGRVAYQGVKQAAALALCARRRVAIDVGGHVGLWSYNLAHEFGQVHAFEPVAEHRECFHRNVPPDEFKNVHLRAMALGDQPGNVHMVTETGSSGNTQVGGKGGDVLMERLDTLGLKDVDLIKIDTEGFEELVLRGGEQTIKDCRPVVVVEQKGTMAARFGLPTLGAVKLLQSWGYKVAKEISGDYLMVWA